MSSIPTFLLIIFFISVIRSSLKNKIDKKSWKLFINQIRGGFDKFTLFKPIFIETVVSFGLGIFFFSDWTNFNEFSYSEFIFNEEGEEEE